MELIQGTVSLVSWPKPSATDRMRMKKAPRTQPCSKDTPTCLLGIIVSHHEAPTARRSVRNEMQHEFGWIPRLYGKDATYFLVSTLLSTVRSTVEPSEFTIWKLVTRFSHSLSR
jgi:hypothetical protein